MNRKQISIEDHRAMGNAFRVAHALLLRLMIDIEAKGGVSKNVKCHNALHTAYLLTLDARNILENVLLEPFSREEANEKRLMHVTAGL